MMQSASAAVATVPSSTKIHDDNRQPVLVRKDVFNRLWEVQRSVNDRPRTMKIDLSMIASAALLEFLENEKDVEQRIIQRALKLAMEGL